MARMEHAVADDGLAPIGQLQRIVDAAGEELGRPIALEDRNLRLLAFSAHEQRDLDPVRAATILRRVNADAELIAWFEAHGALRAERPMLVPGNPRLGLRARVCAPVRCRGTLLGYLWMTEERAAPRASELERLERIAATAGAVLYRERLLRGIDGRRRRELLGGVLADDPRARGDAAARLLELGLWESDGPLTAIVVGLAPPTVAGGLAEEEQVTVDAALEHLRRQLLPGSLLHLVRPDRAILLVSLGDPGVREHGSAWLAARAREQIAAAHDGGAPPPRAALSDADGLASAHAACARALSTLRVADALGGRLGDVVRWEGLGVYALLAELPLERLGAEAIHPGVRALLEQPAPQLLHTLEVYLDAAGDAQRTAAALHVHRATLHHRLRRVQELAGVDLRDGEQRLALHLGLRLARLDGRSWGPSTEGEQPAAEMRRSSPGRPQDGA